MMLRRQIEQIQTGQYQPATNLFDGAPDDIVLLSGDLNLLALELAERDRKYNLLTHEVHHRVKNNLQIVTSLLNMQARKVDDATSKRALDHARMRMGALALIHRLIYEQQSDSAVGSFDAARLMNELGAQLRTAHYAQARLNLSVHAADCEVPVDDAVPLALFAVEAVTNAYQHAFTDRDAGKIVLSFEINGTDAELRVADDGIGFDESEATRSMGHQLMTAFAHQLGGTFNFASADRDGTLVTLRFPLRPVLARAPH